MNNVVIDIDSVDYSYASVPVLENVSLQIHEGEFIGVIGPNAGGKSTLLKLILGLFQPDSGTIRIKHSEQNDLAGLIGYVPQHITFSRDFPITVQDVVMLGHVTSQSRFFRYTAAEQKVAQHAMEVLELGDIKDRQVGSLSGGQLQRVLIARALVCKPEILILDEPTANVDIRAEEDIYGLLKNYGEHMTIIVVSHDISFISSYVDRVACLNRTLVCHSTESISGKMIEELYQSPVKMIDHQHH